jgi:hypothetical protein
MSHREKLNLILDRLPSDRIGDILNFAEFLSWQDERTAWQCFGRAQFAHAYGPDEPEYTTADLRLEPKS